MIFSQIMSPEAHELSRYIYTPLPSSRHIRVLVIHAGSGDAELSCDLREMLLDAPEPFEALSYVWGDDTVKRRIRCGGQDLFADIGVNLYSALRRLRHLDMDRVIWADALCIDQENILERNAQVRQMGHIYSTAVSTIIWLSDMTTELDLSLASLKSFRHSFPEGTMQWGIRFPLILPRIKRTDLSGINFSAIWALFDLPWFERKWIIQEILLSAKPILQIGTDTLPWDTLGQAMLYFSFHPMADSIKAMFTEIENRRAFNAQQLERYRVESTAGLTLGSMKLWDLIISTRGFKCKDPLDQVFSLVGLSQANNSQCLQPDYGIKPRELERRLVEWSIGDGQYLDFIGFWPQRCQGADGDDTVPSWWPEVGRFSDERGMIVHSAFASRFRRGAATSTKVQADLVNNRVLAIRGRIFDEVMEDRIAPRFRLPEDTLQEVLMRETPVGLVDVIDTLAAFKGWLDQAVVLAGTYDTAPPEEQKKHLGTVLCLDNTSNLWASPGAMLGAGLAGLIDHFLDAWDAFVARTETQGEAAQSEAEADGEEIMSALLPVLSAFNAIQTAPSSIGCLMGSQARAFAITANKRYAAVPHHAQDGDRICLLDGVATPCLLRPAGAGRYKMAGNCYVLGMMFSEAPELDDIQEERIMLV